jgi:hypothetical protein
VAMPDKTRNSKLLRDKLMTDAISSLLVTIKIAVRTKRITIVLTKVARFESISATPTLANIAVKAANRADKIAHNCHDVIGFIKLVAPMIPEKILNLLPAYLSFFSCFANP